MIDNLWKHNTPERFWCCQAEIPAETWSRAVVQSAPILGEDMPADDLAEILYLTLGEGQFGPDHWKLGRLKTLYYLVKPAIPRALRLLLRRLYHHQSTPVMDNDRWHGSLDWPVDDRYARFLWAVMRAVLVEMGMETMPFQYFWPHGRRFTLVLTHDIETAAGQAFVRQVAALETSFGLRSSFNFVPERYALDEALIADLQAQGFEVGVHGLNHDGRLFESRRLFRRRVGRINYHLGRLAAVGFRSPCTLRNPYWMQELAIEYDLSFFDTDPFEPMPGGVMTLWPFEIGHFIELPYTLPQDHTLVTMLGKHDPTLWLKKIEVIEAYCGLVLLNTHPDYLREPAIWDIYAAFLEEIKRKTYWNALPRDVARWWRRRTCPTHGAGYDFAALPLAAPGTIILTNEGIDIQG